MVIVYFGLEGVELVDVEYLIEIEFFCVVWVVCFFVLWVFGWWIMIDVI